MRERKAPAGRQRQNSFLLSLGFFFFFFFRFRTVILYIYMVWAKYCLPEACGWLGERGGGVKERGFSRGCYLFIYCIARPPESRSIRHTHRRYICELDAAALRLKIGDVGCKCVWHALKRACCFRGCGFAAPSFADFVRIGDVWFVAFDREANFFLFFFSCFFLFFFFFMADFSEAVCDMEAFLALFPQQSTHGGYLSVHL